jgi:hypothetical protein
MLNVPATWRTGTLTAKNPFTIPPFDRPLRIIVDDDSAEPGTALALLTALADRPGARVYRTTSTSRTRIEILPPNETSDYVPIDYVDADGIVEWAVPAVESWRRSAAMTVEEFGGEPERPRSTRRCGVVFARRPTLRSPERLARCSVCICGPTGTSR